MNLLVFEDEQVAQLFPITVGRAAANVTCGSCTLHELLTALGETPSYLVRSHLREPMRTEGFSVEPTSTSTYRSRPGDPLVLLNARLVPSVPIVERALAAAQSGKATTVQYEGATALAVLPSDAPPLAADASPTIS